eukprot:gb/GEZN01006176.1/.p1 GENE.gb/GEZN01006176.1/~~gb/GEZN01006176.1/.p1  ORF type:complete len:471 (+),score=28.27 gb/GEZN01006176.1/:64-1413(+)
MSSFRFGRSLVVLAFLLGHHSYLAKEHTSLPLSRCQMESSTPYIMVVTSMLTAQDLRPPGWIPSLGYEWTATVEHPPKTPRKHIQPIINQFGKEGSGYLEYILAHYDCLPTVMAFVHNHQNALRHNKYANNHAKFGPEDKTGYGVEPSVLAYEADYLDILNAICWEEVKSYWPLSNSSRLFPRQNPGYQETLDILKTFVPDTLNYTHTSEGILYFCCGTFVVHKSAILQHSKEWWERLYWTLFDREFGGGKGVITGYIIEFLWLSLLGDASFLKDMKELHDWQANSASTRVGKTPAKVDISSIFHCGRTSTLVKLEQNRRNEEFKRKRVEKAKLAERRLERAADPHARLSFCARFIENGKTEDRRLYSNKSCEVDLDGNWRDMSLFVGRKDAGECYTDHGSYSNAYANTPMCACLKACEVQTGLPTTCCHLNETNICTLCATFTGIEGP